MISSPGFDRGFRREESTQETHSETAEEQSRWCRGRIESQSKAGQRSPKTQISRARSYRDRLGSASKVDLPDPSLSVDPINACSAITSQPRCKVVTFFYSKGRIVTRRSLHGRNKLKSPLVRVDCFLFPIIHDGEFETFQKLLLVLTPS